MSVSLLQMLSGDQSLLPTGLPNSGGFINVYQAGTTTPQTCYYNSVPTAYTNPIVLDSSGFLQNSGTRTGEIWLTDGLSYKFVITDASANVIYTLDNVVATKTIYDFSIFEAGKPIASQYLYRAPMVRPLTFNVNLATATGSNAQASASVAATSSYTITIAKNGVSFGTIVFGAGSSSGTITAATPPSFAVGDILSLQGQVTPDATLSDIGIIFNATLS